MPLWKAIRQAGEMVQWLGVCTVPQGSKFDIQHPCKLPMTLIPEDLKR